jgi:hypothetical protein
MTTKKNKSGKNKPRTKVRIIEKMKMPKGPRRRILDTPHKQAFGPVTSISTAPVAIGNSIRGSGSVVKNIAGGVSITGRDFMFPAKASSSISTWCLVGGTPIAPAAFSDSYIRSFLQLYQKFRVRKLIAHYITSSSTSSTGDVLFYFQKNRDSVFLSQTSTQLLPFVMSDKNTVLGPQWSNHSTMLDVKGTWKSTDYGMEPLLDAYSEGELFLLSKTATTDSPGYVIFDYVIDFCEMNVSPRLLSLPISRIQWTNTNLQLTFATTVGTSRLIWSVAGNGIDGNASVKPTGAVVGDVYKVIIDVTNSAAPTNSSGTVATFTNFVEFVVTGRGGGATYVLPLIDGTTLYAAYDGTAFEFFESLDGAASGSGYALAAISGTNTINLQCWLSYVTSIGTINLNPNF